MQFMQMDANQRLKKQPKKAHALQVSLEKKKECEIKALKIVEFLLDNPITEAELLEKCLDINKSYYDDVVEERSIESMCGYPICNNKLKKVNSSQQYHVSLRHNKVFEVKDRKRYCSNICFKASQFLESQLPSCPIWLVDDERPHKLELYHQQKKIGLGNEVIFEDQVLKEELKRSQNEFHNSPSNELCKSMDRIALKDAVAEATITKTNDTVETKCFPRKLAAVYPATHQKLVVETPLSPLESVEQALKQWFTLDTLKFLLGPKQYETALTSKGYDIEKVESVAGLKELRERDALAQKYTDLCRKLDVEELVESALDTKFVQEVQEESIKKGDLPSIERLAKETKQFSLNVQAFYQGRMEVLTEPGSEKHVDGSEALPNEAPIKEKVEEAIAPQFNYPLVDSHSQKALRKRIVLDKLNRVNYTVLQVMELVPRDITTEMRQLVSTFNLQAHNISFKPAEWTLVILIIMHLLAVKMEKIEEALQKESSKKFVAIFLQPFNKQVGYLNQLVSSLMDVNNLVNTDHRG